MAIGRILFLFTVGLLTGVEHFTSATEPCAIEAVDHARVANRAKQIRFPDGRLITVVGHHHGKRQIILLGGDPQRVQAWTSSQFEDFVRKSLADNSQEADSSAVDPMKLVPGVEKTMRMVAGTID